MDEAGRPGEDELVYIKYSAKELLFHQGRQIEQLTASVNEIKLAMVTRQEMTATRRWAIGAAIAATGAGVGLLRAFGV